MAIVNDNNTNGINNADLGHIAQATQQPAGQQATQQVPPSLSNLFNNVGANAQGQGQNVTRKFMTFGREDGLLSFRSGEGTEYTQGVKDTVEKIYKNAPDFNTLDINVYALERSITYDLKLESNIIPLNLAYSYVVVNLTKDDQAWYYIILLEATGRRPLKAEEIMREYNAIITGNNTNGNKHNIYTADDTVTSFIHDLIKQMICKDKNLTKDKVYSVDGLILPTEADFSKIATAIAQIAIDSVYTEAVLAGAFDKNNVQQEDLNIQEAIRVCNSGSTHSNFRYEVYISKQIRKNKVGRPMRSDWLLNLVNSRSLSNIKDAYNVQNARTLINTVGGFIEALPEEVLVQENGQMVPKITFRPNIIITTNEGNSKSTVGFNLLGLMSALVMAKEEMYLKVFRPESKVNVGALNVYAKLDGEGGKIDLSNKKMNIDDVYMFIRKLFTLSPVISMDIEQYGPESTVQSIFAKASQPATLDIRVTKSAQAIIEKAVTLTNGIFPANYPISEIFNGNGIMVPMGTFEDKDGARDIREIDLAYLATYTQDFAVLNSWVFSNTPANISGKDSFITKVNLINSMLPEADITGKALRVTFNSKFLETLCAAIAQAGLVPSYEPEVRLTAQSNLGVLNSYYQNAGLSQGFVGFGTQNVINGPIYNTGYGTMGNYR